MRIRSFVTCALVASAAVVGCASGAPRESAATASSAIQGGAIDTKDSFAVGILYDGGSLLGTCSGALIAPNLVLTARHCVDDAPEQIDCSKATFGARLAGGEAAFTVSTSAEFLDAQMNVVPGATQYHVARIVTPTPTAVCGNDIALLILDRSVPPTEATPATPDVQYPMTDHDRYSTTETAIGYGITAPSGGGAGTRRVRENIDIFCIPNDPASMLDCYSLNPPSKELIAEEEFQILNGTCQGDSGSSAFEQRSYDEGHPISLGVLSRGNVSSDGTTCVNAIYTRADKWRDLIVQAANEAAALGGYPAPAWTLPPPDGGDAGGARDASAPTAGALGAECRADKDCLSHLCLGAPDAPANTFTCSQPCDEARLCPTGFACQGGDCFVSTASGGDGGLAESARATESSGCAIGPAALDPSDPVPWRALASAAMAGIALLRRRRGAG